MSKQGHPQQCDQPADARELYCDRRPPEDPTHVQDQARGFPRPQFPQADGGHRLSVALQSVRPGEPQRSLPQPDGDQRQQPVLQLCSSGVRDAPAAGARPP